MWILTTILAVACLWLFVRNRYVSRAVRDFSQAVEQRKPYLVTSNPRLASLFGVRRLQQAVNDLIEENALVSEQGRNPLHSVESMLEQLQEPVLVVNHRNAVILANEAFCEQFACGTGCEGRRLESLLPSAEVFEFVREIQRGHAMGRKEIEVHGKAVHWFEISGARLSGAAEEEDLCLLVLHDVSRLKRLEKMRTEFVANVSHELRTPLTVLKGFSDTLVEDHRELSPEDRDRFLQKVQRNVERLNHLVEDLLILSRLEAAPYQLARDAQPLPQVIFDAVEDVRSRDYGLTHQVLVDIDPTIDCVPMDAVKISQVFENLLDNAFKYCRAPSIIRAGARLGEGYVECFVEDNGPGIPARDLPHIFERFYRVDKARSREQGGTGLGLAIVKHIVQHHGGSVSCESVIGKGTCFTFTLPLPETVALGVPDSIPARATGV